MRFKRGKVPGCGQSRGEFGTTGCLSGTVRGGGSGGQRTVGRCSCCYGTMKPENRRLRGEWGSTSDRVQKDVGVEDGPRLG
jgi:hypothetical protein